MYLDSDTLVSLGLLEAEMTKNGNSIVFSNSEPLIINHIIEWFEKNFKISRNNWKWLIQFNKKFVNQESLHEMRSREFASFIFWIQNVHINKDNHFPKWVIYRGFDEGCLTTEDKWGMLSIYCGNKNIKKFIDYFQENFYDLISNLAESQITNYLDGLFCGDGGVNLSNDVRRIFVASFHKNDKKIMNLFSKLRILAYISGNEIFISNLRDLFRLYKINFFSKSPTKRLQLLELLLSYKKFQGRAKTIKKEFEMQKNILNNEYELIWNLLNTRTNFFNNLFLLCRNKFIRPTSIKMPVEVKLNGLARKPKRFVISEIIYANPRITHKEIIDKTGLSYSSVKHITQRLFEEKYIEKEHLQPFNYIKILPTNKMRAEISSARKMRNIFNRRYMIPEVIKNAVQF